MVDRTSIQFGALEYSIVRPIWITNPSTDNEVTSLMNYLTNLRMKTKSIRAFHIKLLAALWVVGWMIQTEQMTNSIKTLHPFSLIFKWLIIQIILVISAVCYDFECIQLWCISNWNQGRHLGISNSHIRRMQTSERSNIIPSVTLNCCRVRWICPLNPTNDICSIADAWRCSQRKSFYSSSG